VCFVKRYFSKITECFDKKVLNPSKLCDEFNSIKIIISFPDLRFSKYDQ